jgi:hypothetical protein
MGTPVVIHACCQGVGRKKDAAAGFAEANAARERGFAGVPMVVRIHHRPP